MLLSTDNDKTRLGIKPICTNPSPLSKLPCPKCGMINLVPRAGVYIRCEGCSAKLVSVHVRHKSH